MPLLLATRSCGVISFCPGKFLIKAAFLNEIPLKEMKKNEQITTGSTPPLLRRQRLTRAGRFHDDELTAALQQPQLPAAPDSVCPGATVLWWPPPASFPPLGTPFCPRHPHPSPGASPKACSCDGAVGTQWCAAPPVPVSPCVFWQAPSPFPALAKIGLGDERWLLSLSPPPPANS